MESRAQQELGARLRKRRQEAGLTVDELAEKASLDADAIRAHERGKTLLFVSQLARIADAFDIPLVGLISPEAPETPAPRSLVALLKTTGVASLSVRDLEELSRQLRRARALASLSELSGETPPRRLVRPHAAPKKQAYLDGYKAANDVRRQLELPGVLRNLRRLVEDRFGIYVAEVPFHTPMILGASSRSGAGRLIALAKGKNEAKRRFVLAHELAHHLLDFDGDQARVDEDPEASLMDNPPAEQRANAFAAMLLASENSVRDELGPPRREGYGLVEAKKLALLVSKTLGLSFAAAAWHLHNLKYILDDTVRALLHEPRRDEVSGFEELGADVLERRVQQAVAGNLISSGRARELLGTAPDFAA